ncbi:MAG TPA: PIG-L family deacetylase [Candidatus Acidoferrales bacterium]|nr:PIG-L family deacetylase [Candidatus Acidoferrales bacterium]
MGAGAPADELAAAGWQVTRCDDPDRLEHGEGVFGLAALDGPIGEYEWDRWLLQRVHGLLEAGGALVCSVPNLLALGLPDRWPFFAARAALQLRRSMSRALRLAPPAPRPFAGRRYRVRQFLAMLAPLGYFDVRCRPAAGSPAPFTGEYVVEARKAASLLGADAGRPFPARDAHVRLYETASRAFLEAREAWRRAHAGLRVDAPRPLATAEFAGQNALVLAPHPDDEIIGCGGTLAALVAAGARVTVLQATDGSEGASLLGLPVEVRRSLRLREAAEVGRTMGFHDVVYWREDNGNFRCTGALVDQMKALLVRLQPRLVFTPFLADAHPDHATLNRIFAHACGVLPPQTRVLQYEVWGLVPANRYCDVTAAGALLERALLQYEAAMKVDDFVHFCENRNLYHAYTLAGTAGRAEAFLDLAIGEFARLAPPDRTRA